MSFESGSGEKPSVHSENCDLEPRPQSLLNALSGAVVGPDVAKKDPLGFLLTHIEDVRGIFERCGYVSSGMNVNVGTVDPMDVSVGDINHEFARLFLGEDLSSKDGDVKNREIISVLQEQLGVGQTGKFDDDTVWKLWDYISGNSDAGGYDITSGFSSIEEKEVYRKKAQELFAKALKDCGVDNVFQLANCEVVSEQNSGEIGTFLVDFSIIGVPEEKDAEWDEEYGQYGESKFYMEISYFDVVKRNLEGIRMGGFSEDEGYDEDASLRDRLNYVVEHYVPLEKRSIPESRN